MDIDDNGIQFTEHERDGRRWTRAISQHVAVDRYEDGEVIVWFEGKQIKTDEAGMLEMIRTLSDHLKGMVERVN